MTQEKTPLQKAAERVLVHSHMHDTEAFRYQVGIDLLRDLEYALADEQGRERRMNWTPK